VSSIVSINVEKSNVDLPDSLEIDFSEEDLLIYQSMLVQVKGLILKEPTEVTGTGGVNFNLVDESGETVIIFRIESERYLGEDIRNEIVELVNSFEDGTEIDIVGGIMGWFNGPQIIITNVNQIIPRD
jgi:hypothetical protein